MSIKQLDVHGIRNLQSSQVFPSGRINIISGTNGSGKTSLLEGIHILGLGRSFRTRHLRNAIQHGANEMTLFARLDDEQSTTLGVRRFRDQRELELRIKHRKQVRLVELAGILPLQLINPDAFRLLEGSPSGRREFLDWGVFHVKHEFFSVWKRARRALKHRNSLLRRGRISFAEIEIWEHELANSGEKIDQQRREWFAKFLPVFEETLQSLLPLPGLTLSYARGWDKNRSLADVLASGRATDEQMGFTQQGPQRADLKIKMNKQPAVEVLSRGQQKMVVSALKLAQGRFLESTANRHCVYLIDDLPAELDELHRQRFCQLLESIQCQAFITSVEPTALQRRWLSGTDVKMFHVKHVEQDGGVQPLLSQLIEI